MDEQTIVVFECDQKQCRECMGECRHTTDVRHAKNFKRVEPGYYEEIAREANAQDKSERTTRRLLNARRRRRKRT
jgi:hypothetical protein